MPSAPPKNIATYSSFSLVTFDGSHVCAVPSLPSGVALPGGLSSSSVSAGAAASLLPVAPENAVRIRLRASLSVSDTGDTRVAVESQTRPTQDDPDYYYCIAAGLIRRFDDVHC